jgi:hypothetical protein
MTQGVDGESHKEVNSFISLIIWVLQTSICRSFEIVDLLQVFRKGKFYNISPEILSILLTFFYFRMIEIHVESALARILFGSYIFLG